MTFHDDSSKSENELRTLFDGLRESETARAPDAGVMLSRARTRAAAHSRPRSFPFRITLPLAAAAVLVLWIAVGPRSDESNFRRVVAAWTENPALGAWRSPTDFLLDVPGHELLSTVPRIGQSDAMLLPGQPTGARANDTTNGDRT